MLIEYAPDLPREAGERPETLFEFFDARGYVPGTFVAAMGRFVPAAAAAVTARIGANRDEDLLFAPRDRFTTPA